MSHIAAHLPAAPPLATQLPHPQPRRGRLIALGTVLLAAAATLLATTNGPAPAEPDLALLLRSMAVTKAGLALGAAWLVGWRLRHPAPAPVTFGLLAAMAGMAAGAALIWRVTPAGAGAITFHASLALALLTLAADRRALAALLAARAQSMLSLSRATTVRS